MKVIQESVLRTIVEEDGCVAIVHVAASELVAPGTRSEAVMIDAQVVRAIYGRMDETVGIFRYTRDGDILLQPGGYYAVALVAVPAYAPRLFLEGFEEISSDSVDVSAERHRRVLNEIEGAR